MSAFQKLLSKQGLDRAPPEVGAAWLHGTEDVELARRLAPNLTRTGAAARAAWLSSVSQGILHAQVSAEAIHADCGLCFIYSVRPLCFVLVLNPVS